MSINIAPITETVTKEQLGRAADRFIAKSFKFASTMPKEIVQKVLDEEPDELAKEMYEVLRARVERRAEMIVRPFKVDRTKKPRQLLDACKRVPWYIDDEVLKSMPMDGPEEGELVFFPLRRDTPIAEIKKVLDDRSLIPDYAAQMQVNADDSAFADDHPNGMQWGTNSYAYFFRDGDGREVRVLRDDSRWSGYIWFAGRRKPATA